MISTQEAANIVNKHLGDFGVEEIPLAKSINSVLAEDVYADRDFPPFDRVMMDGIAINYKAWEEGNKRFNIEGIQYAGDPVKHLEDYKNCLEVMTGAMLPTNADTIIKYEDFTVNDGQVTIELDSVQKHQHVHAQGKDKGANELLLEKGTMMSPAEIAILATVGKAEVMVRKMPTIAVISSGDELVDVNELPKAHQIRKSNVYALQASLSELGIDAGLHHIVDEPGMMKNKIEGLIADNDVLILSGGVSKGKKDYMPEVLSSLGVKKLFHKVKQRPGKPFWFGVTDSGTCVFAFPGNPVSTYMCFYKYFIPWLSKSMGVNYPENKAKLAEDFEFKPGLTYFLQVATSNENGQIMARPIMGQGSGDFANLSQVDAFLELTSDRDVFKAGEVLPLIRYRGSYSK